LAVGLLLPPSAWGQDDPEPPPPDGPFVATVASIEARVERLTLENDIRVALLPKRTRGRTVEACLAFHFGGPETLTGQRAALTLLPEMLQRGSAQLSRADWLDALRRLQTEVRFWGIDEVEGGPGTLLVSLTSDQAHLPEALELVGRLLRHPLFSPDEFEAARKDHLTSLKQAGTDPRRLAVTDLRRALTPWPPGHLHYIPTIPEQVDALRALTREDVERLFTRTFGASGLCVSIVGDFERAATVTALQRAFSTFTSPVPYERVPRPAQTLVPVDVSVPTPDSPAAWVLLGTVLPFDDGHPDFAALDLAVQTLAVGGQSRLADRLRREGGLAYLVQGHLQPKAEDDWTALVCYAICPPAQAARVRQIMREEFQRWAAEGLTEQELRSVRIASVQMFNNALASDSIVAHELVRGLCLDRTLRFQQRLIDRGKTLTLRQVNAALAKHVQGLPLVSVATGDVGQPQQ